MIDREEIAEAIERTQAGSTTWAAVERLAALYTVQEHLGGQAAYSAAAAPDEPINADELTSDFGAVVKGKPTPAVMLVIDELMDALQVMQPNLYTAVMHKLDAIP